MVIGVLDRKECNMVKPDNCVWEMSTIFITGGLFFSSVPHLFIEKYKTLIFLSIFKQEIFGYHFKLLVITNILGDNGGHFEK